MSMPSTRRERYLFFRARAERRQLQSWKNRPRPGVYAHHCFNRSHDTRALPKQWAYEGTPRGPWQLDYWEGVPDSDPLKGTYRHPGVVNDGVHPLGWWGPNTHWKYRGTDYYQRRQKRIPWLRNLPLRPFITPTGPLAYQQHYPYYRYPSGQLNANWWKGLDDDGLPPPERP